MPEPAKVESIVSDSRIEVFGALLRTMRMRAGLSQDRLAERAGISAKAIGALEQGARSAAHDQTIDRLANALEATEADRAALFSAAQESRARRRNERATTPQHNLPASLTSFIERPEVDEIVKLLKVNRLVTVTGTGGVGKTRTAIEAARLVVRANENLWFLDLSHLQDRAAILSELANVLGVTLAEHTDTYAAIEHHLRDHTAYIVIDNCEHLLDGVAELVQRLLRSCPHLSILATSREPLQLSFEASFRLPSLDVPAHRPETADEALEYSAVRLFVARAESSHSTWLLKPDSLTKIGELCRRLDGIPLAIELAASRVSTLGLDMLVRDLGRGLTLSGKRDYPERHQTMTATIAWSYDLLDATEQAVLRRLSFFAGKFSLEIAERVCTFGDIQGYAIGDACHRLAQKSLIVVEYGEPVHYRLLSAIRTFGDQQLSPSERDATHRGYIRWLREMSQALPRVPGAALKYAGPYFNDVRAGIERCRERGGQEDIVDGATILAGLWAMWFETNRNRELRHYVEFFLSRIAPETAPQVVARLHTAVCAYSTYDELAAATARAVPFLVAAGDHSAAALALSRLSSNQFQQGDSEDAHRSMAHAFEFLDGRDPVLNTVRPRCLQERAWQFLAQGRLAEAHADLQELNQYLNDETDPDRLQRRKIQLSVADLAFVSGDTLRAIALLESEFDTSAEWTPRYRFCIHVSLAVYYLGLGNTDTATRHVRTVMSDLTDPDSVNLADYQHILLPAAVIAIAHGRPRLGGIIFGHWKHHCLKSRAVWNTEVPAYEQLVSLLDGQFSMDEANALFAEGASTVAKELIHNIGAESLFAPSFQSATC